MKFQEERILSEEAGKRRKIRSGLHYKKVRSLSSKMVCYFNK